MGLRSKRYAQSGLGAPRLCPSGHVGDLGPGLKGLGPGGSVLIGGDVIAAEMKEVVDLVMGGEEALCLSRRLEPLHLPLAWSGWLVRVFCPVVETLMLPVLNARHDLPLCRPIAGQLISDHDTRRPHLPLQQLP